MRRALLFLILLAPCAAAQAIVEPGARVRLIQAQQNEPRRSGAVVSIGADSLGVTFSHSMRTALPPDVRQLPKARLELLTATHRRTGRGMLIGAPVLAITGHYWGSHGFGAVCDGGRYSYSCVKDNSMVLPLTVVGGLAGLGAGA